MKTLRAEREEVILRLANKIFPDKRFPISERFLQVNKETFQVRKEVMMTTMTMAMTMMDMTVVTLTLSPTLPCNQAEPETCDYEGDPSGSAGKINSFVSRETGQKINQIVRAGDFDDLTAVVLVNAIYFKGKWELPFNPCKTNKEEAFHVTPRRKVSAPIMHTDGHYFYLRAEGVKAEMLEMPYKVRGKKKGGKMK